MAVRGASIEASVRRARLQAAAADARFRHTLARSLLPASSSRPKVRPIARSFASLQPPCTFRLCISDAVLHSSLQRMDVIQ